MNIDIFLQKEPLSYSQEDYYNLVKRVQNFSYLYYVLDTPEISDADYDFLLKKIIAVEDLFPEWKTLDSPSLKIGGEVRSDFPKFKRDIPMLSLENVDSYQEFIEFDNRLKKNLASTQSITQQQDLFSEELLENKNIIYHCEPKFDGLAIELIYEKGILTIGATRGDGEIGEEITHNIRTIKNIPLSLHIEKCPDYISIRGEVILPLQDFYNENLELEQKGEKLYANPRNLAAGTLRQKDSALAAKRNLKFFPYNVGTIIENDHSKIKNPLPETQDQLLKYFKLCGFEIAPYSKIANLKQVKEYFDSMLLQRANLPFDIDGLAIKLNNRTLWTQLGATSKYPRYAVAFKFPPQIAITQIEDIVFQVGRTGTVTPVANLKPINIGGVIVKRASLHNIDELKRLNVAPKDWVEVLRAGDVIPKVVRVTQKETNNEFHFITHCPSCNSLLIKEDVYIKCENINCPDKNIAALEFLVSKAGLNIEGLGSEWITIFYKNKLVTNIADLYNLKLEDINQLPGMGDILPQKIIDAIYLKRNVPYATFIKSLGIYNVGEHIAEVLAKNFSPLEKIQNASIEDLSSTHEIGMVIAQSVYDYFHNESNLKIINELFITGFRIIYPEKLEHSDKLENLTFVFTGSLIKTTREEAESLVKSMGGRAASSVSAKTSYVVAGESAGSKLKKAQDLGVPILTEEEFENFIHQIKTK